MFSEKAYKAQFRVWKWEKNLKKPVVDFMLQKLEERKRQGKSTRFRYRGNEVLNSKLQRHSKGVTRVSDPCFSRLSGVSYYTSVSSKTSGRSNEEPSQSASDPSSCKFMNLKQSFERKLNEIMETVRQEQNTLGHKPGWNKDVCSEIELALVPFFSTGSADRINDVVPGCSHWISTAGPFDSVALPLLYFTARCQADLGRYAESEVILDKLLVRYNQLSTMDSPTYVDKIIATVLLFSKVLLVQHKLCTLETLLISIQKWFRERSILLPSQEEFLLQRLLNITIIQQIDLEDFDVPVDVWRLAISFHHEKLWAVAKRMVHLVKYKNLSLDKTKLECVLGSLEILRRYHHADDAISDTFSIVLTFLNYILSQVNQTGTLFFVVLNGLRSSQLKTGRDLIMEDLQSKYPISEHWYAFFVFKRKIATDFLMEDWPQLALPQHKVWWR